MADLITVVISRKTWLRGEGHARSRLLRTNDGKKCCVGEMCLAAGIPAEYIKDVGEVESIDPINIRPPLHRFDFNALYNVNDTPVGELCPLRSGEPKLPTTLPMTEELREAEIIRLAAKRGFDVSFVD